MNLKRVGPISILHIVALSMTMIGLKNHVTILPPILEVGGRDGWMSVILAAVIMCFWIFILVYIYKQAKQRPLMEWLQEATGPKTSTIFRYVVGIYLFVLAAFTMREAMQWVKTTFLPTTSIIVLLIIYIVLCILLATSNIQTIAIVNVMVLFGVLVLGFFVAFVNIQVKDYSLIRPFLEHGWEPVLKASIFPAAGYIELILLLFLQQHIKDKMRWYHFAIILFLLMGLTLGPLLGAITEFGPHEAAEQNYPAYEEWGLVTIGQFIEHLDFFSIYQWLTGAFIRVGLLLFISIDLLKMKNKKPVWFILAPAFFIICMILTLINDNLFLFIKGNYFLITTFVFFLLVSIFLFLIAFFHKKTTKKEKRRMKGGKQSETNGGKTGSSNNKRTIQEE